MSRLAPQADPQTLEAYARKLVAGRDSSRVLALAADPQYSGPDRIDVDGRTVVVRGCVSALAIRELLSEVPAEQHAIVLTDRSAVDLGDSLVARFRRQRVEPLDAWATVPGMFAARHVAAGLRQGVPWLPELLVDLAPVEGYPPSPTPEVTRDHIFGSLAEVVFDVPQADVGLGSLLTSLSAMRVREAWARIGDDARAALSGWVEDRAGAGASGVLALAASPVTSHLHVLALGLMLDVLYNSEPTADIRQARAVWENGFQLPRVPAGAAAEVGEASRSAVVSLGSDPAEQQGVWRDTPMAFALAGYPDGIQLSSVHPDGYRARLSALAAALDSAAEHSQEASLEAVQAHVLARAEFAPHTEQATMAVRLLRWLRSQQQGKAPGSLGGALDRQVQEDGWVDHALAQVWSGSVQPDVAAAYERVCTRVATARRAHDEQFATLLAEATSVDTLPEEILPVERVLAEVVQPLTAAAGVLLIVIDGMSASVAAAVGQDLSALAWEERLPTGRQGRSAVLSALPTMTRYSRTSLLCGALREGSQVDEKREFTAITGGPVFHKDDLRAPAGSAVNPAVEQAVGSAAKVVGVVLNTVDDTLAKHDPDGTRWSVQTIGHLPALLEMARRYNRVVVITSDHGHVVERGSRADAREYADARWRPASTGQPGPEEVLLAGRRVLAGGGRIVAPWVEDLRYGRKAAGYHGGASAAEVTIPLMVFADPFTDLSGAGWVPAPGLVPTWWERPAATTPTPAPRRSRRKPAPQGPTLFGETPADPDAAAVETFLASPVYTGMRASAGRAALPDSAVARALRVLLAGKGRATLEQISAAVAVAPSRGQWALTGLRRLLNVEGYSVVAVDADGRTVLLDVPLWRQQFRVDG